MSFLSKIFGDANDKYLKKMAPIIQKVNDLEGKFEKFSDKKIKQASQDLKEKVQKNPHQIEEFLPQAFALVREAAKRTLGQRHYDEQLMCGIALHRGQVIEMKTGEGKTLAATLAVYFNALRGEGVHVVTVNDYLARRDAVWMGQIYHFLGLSVACIQQQQQSFEYDPAWQGAQEQTELDEKRDETGSFHIVQEFLKPCPRKQAYQSDITYGTNNEFGFDYLRDNMVFDLDRRAQREHVYAIIDEVDSILIDEARTPLIISRPDEQSSELYKKVSGLIPRLSENTDYNVDEKMRAVSLTEEGINHVEQFLGMKDIYSGNNIDILHHLEQALKANILFKKDKDYVIKDGQVVIVDDFTGRLMPGRRYSEGLHQAIEAKEGVEIKRESRTLATITFQNYFKLYDKLAGMTGTATSSAEEFHKVYDLDVTIIPTHKPLIRKDKADSIYQTEQGKYKAIIKKVKESVAKNQPVLIGTISIEKNEYLSALFKKEGVKHNLLNAKHHEQEGEIIAQAGQPGNVTVATNMAGRGVDIVLGGNPPTKEAADKVKEAGGLCVIGTERHEARRIDNQLRGRSGRQGDPGESQFFVSLEDDLMRIFGSDRIKNLMGKFGVPEDQPIENAMVSRAIESAQAKIEGFHFDARKHVLEYDNVMNAHRTTIYKKRKDILKSDNLFKILKEYLNKEIDELINALLQGKQSAQWQIEELSEEVQTLFNLDKNLHKDFINLSKENLPPEKQKEEIRALIFKSSVAKIKTIRQEMGESNFNDFNKALFLSTIDFYWMEHLDGMSHLRDSVRLRAYGQRDPLVEYKNEGYQRFKELLGDIRNEVLKRIFRIEIRPQNPQTIFQKQPQNFILKGAAKTQDKKQQDVFSSQKTPAHQPAQQSNRQADELKKQGARIAPNIPDKFRHAGRNDPCPCGSGKKYKKCCWDKYH
jgi:preprotein translocase subunit SecA